MDSRLKNIRLLLLDVDGVLTDGRIVFDSNGVETKAFDVKDGHGLKMVQRAGVKVGLLTGRTSEVTRIRAQELGIDLVIQGAKDKLAPYLEILKTEGLSDAEVAYVGDDVVDLPVLRRVGFAATVSDAVDEVKPAVHYIASRAGGRGAVREICDLLLRGAGLWEGATVRYFEG